MSLSEQIARSLADLKGLASETPRTVGWSVDGGPAVEAGFTAIDSLSCAVRELRISAPEFSAAPLPVLREWADRLCQRVTYLLEPIGPLEADAESASILVRSIPPSSDGPRKAYYEMYVAAPGVVSLRRYVAAAGNSERRQVDLQLTHEAFLKLVRDIAAAIPALSAA